MSFICDPNAQNLGNGSGVALLIIDPQNDFHPGGSLGIPTADEDAERIAKLITTKLGDISNIIVTMDSHQRMHIAHGLFWKDESGKHPTPFTMISHADVVAGKWKASVEADQEKALAYAEGLEAGGRFQICIWPEHCIIGTTGHNIRKCIMDAINLWAETTKKEVTWVWKGMNCYTEMYSALAAEVPVESDSRTLLNVSLVRFLSSHDSVLVCGQALSHCVNFTTRDLMDNYGDGDPSKVTILTNATSAVPGFESSAKEFLEDMKALGVQLKTTDQV